MSILIKGVDMPKESWDCPCHDGETGWCKVTGHSCDAIPKDCPLVEVNDDAEPADVVEVVHGEWVECDDWWDGVYYECSACKEAFTFIYGTPTDNLYNFCPNCGAKMDKGLKL